MPKGQLFTSTAMAKPISRPPNQSAIILASIKIMSTAPTPLTVRPATATS